MRHARPPESIAGTASLGQRATLLRMYLPAQFQPTESEVADLLGTMGAADLVTVTARGMLVTTLPFLYDPPGSRAGSGPLGNLVGHVARQNDQWREPAIGEALVIVRGPDAYVTPSWYATKREHGRVVPTWNYVTAHIYGSLEIHDDPVWVEALVRRLTERFEQARPAPWSVDDAPAAYIAGQMKAIVGVELRITRLEAKAKLSQNRSAEDVEGVIEGLVELGSSGLATAMGRRSATPPSSSGT